MHRYWMTAVIVLLMGVSPAWADSRSQTTVPIAAQPLSQALGSFANQTGLQLVYVSQIAKGLQSSAVPAGLAPSDALALLLRGTGLRFEFINDRTVRIINGDAALVPTSSDKELKGSPAVALGRESEGSSSTLVEEPLQEIVVTATRREESLSRIPLSVSALTQSTIDDRGIKDLSDVVRFVPGLAIIDQGNYVNVSIRGIGSSAGASTTGIYIDDTPIQARALSFSSQALPKAFDLDRIEVLRGPQGTLFGAGSEGGTVRYIMQQPSLSSFSSNVKAEVSNTERGAPSYEVGVAAGGPIVEGTLGMRASVWYRRDGGWIDLVDPTTFASVTPNNNFGESMGARIAATWAPTASITVTPSFIFQDRKLHSLETYWGILSNPGSGRFVSADPSRVPGDDSYGLGSLKITADLGSVQIISNTSQFHRKDAGGYDGTLYILSYYQQLGWPSVGLPFQGSACPTQESCYPFLDGSGVHLPPSLQNYRAPASIDLSQSTFTQEFRVQSRDPSARLTWTAGAFFSSSRSTSFEQIRDPMVDEFFQGVFGTPMCIAFEQPCNADGSTYLPNGDNFFNSLTGHDRQLAGFVEANWAITPRLKLTTGGRYSKVDFTSSAYSDGPANGGAYRASGEQHEKPVTKRVNLAFQEDSSNLYYASFSTGFRPGGANASIPVDVCAVDLANFGIANVPESYGSDTVKSYEIGAKNNFNGRFKISSSLYYIKWSSIQQGVQLPTCALLYTANLGEAVSKGGDVEIQWALLDSTIIEASVGYTDARYTKSSFPGPSATAPVVADGDAISSGQGAFAQPIAPWTVSIGAQHNFQAFGHKSFARIDYEYFSKNGKLTPAEDPQTVQYDPYLTTTPSSSFLSARLGTSINDFSVALFVDNVLDTHTVTSMGHTGLDGYGPQPPASPLFTYTTFRPRTYGLSFAYRH